MDRKMMRTLEDVALKAVNKYCTDNNLPIVATFNSGSYAPEYGKFSITCANKSADTGHVMDEDAVSLNRWGKLVGHGDLVGLQIVVGNELYELVGFKTRSNKYPFIARRLSNGLQYKLGWSAEESIKAAAKRRLIK